MPRPDDADPQSLAELLHVAKSTWASTDESKMPETSVSGAADHGRFGEYELLEKLGEGGMALIAQRGVLWPTADIYTVDLETLSVEPVWEDLPDQYKDARPLWSPGWPTGP